MRLEDLNDAAKELVDRWGGPGLGQEADLFFAHPAVVLEAIHRCRDDGGVARCEVDWPGSSPGCPLC